MDRRKILQQIRDAGVVGAGGAGFPTYKKLDSTVENIIVNGVECEPLLQKDRETMLQAKGLLFRGLEVIQRLTGASNVTVVVKDKNVDVIEAYDSDLKQRRYKSLVYPDVYPAGDEFVLVYEVTGRRVPPGGIPLEVGCLVDNVETIVNIAQAVDGTPVTEKYLTIAGEVHNPQTTIVPIGMSMRDCFEMVGGLTVATPVVLTGGLMMGGTETDLDQPVTKTMGGLIPLPSNHYLVRRKTASQMTYTRIGHGQCDQCSLCTELCPRYTLGYPIEPHRVMRTLLMTGEARERGSLWAANCCECNICSLIACPEELDPKNICVDAKKVLREQDVTWTPREIDELFRNPHPAHKGREIPIETVYRRLGLQPYMNQRAYFNNNGFQPSQVTIPLNSHIGTPAKAIVSVGDLVKKGDVLGEVAVNQLGCPAHASISGRVTAVTETAVQISS